MQDSSNNRINRPLKIALRVFAITLTIAGVVLFLVKSSTLSNDKVEQEYVAQGANRIENGIHVRTGLIEGEGLMEVVYNCTNCHTAQIIIQNRMNAEAWATTIDWMQETQNLWDLGENEDIIINYLVTNYPVKPKGRRVNLVDVEWYELDE
ncbi:monoheme cytochrome C [Spongiivirga sp. MCCC 1A20706]|uniref:monoheme cytochrome C n=1 Tax=Spongiivirga sp. MCCC 1A20706 TaxID=3160963 RepID=UPI0039778E41